jgi:hypothetical protein
VLPCLDRIECSEDLRVRASQNLLLLLSFPEVVVTVSTRCLAQNSMAIGMRLRGEERQRQREAHESQSLDHMTDVVG